MRLRLNETGMETRDGQLYGVYELHKGSVDLKCYTDVDTYRCSECKVVFDTVSMSVMEMNCRKHTVDEVRFNQL